MENQDKKPNIIAIIGAIVLLVLAVVGLSYAFFSAFIKNGETDPSIEGTGANLSLVYTDGKSVITSSNIMPGWSATKTFTVTNNGEADTYYKLNISNITNEFVDGGLTFSIASADGGTSVAEQAVGTTTRTISPSITIAEGATHTYTVTAKYINLNTDQTPDLGKSFSYTIGIEASQKPTFKDIILANNEVKTPITTPGAAVSTSSEALLASAEDDYGTSYYFRGAVTNNYVEFANKCWRIVRIGGDNTVKLILHNDNISNASNPCSSANNSTTAAFVHYDGNIYKSEFNSNYNDNAYVGFMYGTPGSTTYEATHANTNKSTILTNLETYESVIDNNVFCNDKSLSSGSGYSANATDYAARERLYTSKIPSLKCNGELSKITSKIGLITADELAFAGYAVRGYITTSYLKENATGYSWWSLSPAGFYNKSLSYVFRVRSDNDAIDICNVNVDSSVRPVISLVSSITISGVSGTSEDPYVVK